MGGWKTKFVFLLIVYFAGFATAIYTLVPVPGTQVSQQCEKDFSDSAFKSGEFAQSFNVKMHKCLDVAKDAAWRAGRFVKQKVKQKLDDRRQTDG